MRRNPIVREVSDFMLPAILLYALYIQFHGEYSPGGGFQAGVMFGVGIILYGMVHGLERTQRIIPPGVIRFFVSFGLLLYIAVGYATMLLGGNFLDYNTLWPAHGHEHNPHGQHLGILVIELGVGITVAAVMVAVYYGFASRCSTYRDGAPPSDQAGNE